ncbi:MAG: phage tail protein [Rhodopseudomonas sp.]|nr:phage tail protein [Rhodopseudomonas sp.]
MSIVFLGQVTMFAGSFAPRGYALCDGQLLSISQNDALFALLGTVYGGDGVQTFALPNLKSRLSIHQGQGNGLPNYSLGQPGGSPNVTITTTTMPAHSHSLVATKGDANTGTIGSSVVLATATGTGALFYAAEQAGKPPLDPVAMNPLVCSRNGGSLPHSNLMPSLCVNFIIALAGIFPSRN